MLTCNARHETSTKPRTRPRQPTAHPAFAGGGAVRFRGPRARRPHNALRMLFNRSLRDWDRGSAHEDRPRATSGNHLPESSPTHRVILGPVPRIPEGPSRGQGIDHLESHNRDFRHNAENDPVDVARSRMESDLLVRVPRAGGGPVLREAQTRAHRSALTRADQAAAGAGDTAVGEALSFAAPAISGPRMLRFAP